MSEDNFDSLAAGISNNERQAILDNIQKKNELISDTNVKSDVASQQVPETLKEKISTLSLFQRIILWFKSMIKGSDIESVYNSYLLSKSGALIESQYPGLLNYKKGLFLDGMFEKLSQLKDALAFFVPYTTEYEENRSQFYVYLASIIIPEISEEIKTVSDPFQYPFDKELNSEMRASLIAKMENVINRISQEDRNQMYVCAKAVEWLANAIRLPINKFLLKFVMDESGHKECPINQVSSEVVAFSRFFGDIQTIPDELIRALYFFSERSNLSATKQSVDAADEQENSFLSNAESKNGMLRMFAKYVPCAELAKIATNDAMYIATPSGGGEDWMQLFKNQQKVLFDRRWADWLVEYKKEKVKSKLFDYFKIQSFPKFPVRPWALYEDEVKFGFEYTLGFIYSFIQNFTNPYMAVLKTLSIEGDFAIKENRIEFIETYSGYEKLNDDMENLMGALSQNGEYGMMFESLASSESDSASRLSALKDILADLENFVKEIVTYFGKVSRSMTNLLSTATGERSSQYYGPVVNINKIQAGANREFREALYAVKNHIEHSFLLLPEIEALDTEKNS